MGVIRGAMKAGRKTTRVAYRTTRTTYRATSSVARGRVPSVGVRVGVPGARVRVGTNGIRVKTPIARVSVGTGGVRLTAGRPGIAHVTVAPLRPSATVGLGPLRATAARHPGIGVRTGLVGVGVTTQPLLWAYVGGFRFAIPGRYQSTTQRWHEEIDQQWRGDYKRRPPSFVASLHDVIKQVENDATRLPFRSLPSLVKPLVLVQSLSTDEIGEIEKSARSEEFQKFNKWKFWEWKQHLAIARDVAAARIKEREELFRQEANELQHDVDSAFSLWHAGESTANSLVLSAYLQVQDCPAFVIEISSDSVLLLVIAPDIEDVHPEKPDWTSSGAKSVKKRTKAERVEVHSRMVLSVVLHAMQMAAHVVPGNREIRVVVAMRSDDKSAITDLPVVADCSLSSDEIRDITGSGVEDWRREDALHQVAPGVEKQKKPLKQVLPEIEIDPGIESTALAIEASSMSDLESPAFWLELHDVLLSLRNMNGEKKQLRPKSGSDKASKSHKAQKTKIVIDDSSLSGPTDVQNSRRDALRGKTVESMEVFLNNLAGRTEAAVKAADSVEVLKCQETLLSGIGSVKAGAEDEFELVLWELVDYLMVKATDDQIRELRGEIKKAPTFVAARCQAVLQRLDLLVEIRKRVLEHIDANPGVLQSTLPKILEREPTDVRLVCWYLEHFDVVLRVKKGSSYLLYRADSAADN